MTHEELAACDGREGRRAWVAVNGRVYDFTDSPLWSGGDHQGAHRAGCDLSAELLGAPHVRAVIERYPVVGDLREVRAPAPAAGPGLAKLIAALAAVLVVLGILWLALR